MAILVVGGAGYIGSHAARALRRAGYEAIIYDSLVNGHRRLADGFELVEGDIADEAKPMSGSRSKTRASISTTMSRRLLDY